MKRYRGKQKHGEINAIAARSSELRKCKRSANKRAEKGESGEYIYVPETRCKMLIETGRDPEKIIKRHIKHFNAQRNVHGFGKSRNYPPL